MIRFINLTNDYFCMNDIKDLRLCAFVDTVTDKFVTNDVGSHTFGDEDDIKSIPDPSLRERCLSLVPHYFFSKRHSVEKLLQLALTLSYKQDSTGIWMAYPQHTDQGVSLFGNLMPGTKKVMVNRLDPGCHVPIHVDARINNLKRFHLPILTNLGAYFWNEWDGFYHMTLGCWYQIDQCHPHAIGNIGATERIHIVLDVEV